MMTESPVGRESSGLEDKPLGFVDVASGKMAPSVESTTSISIPSNEAGSATEVAAMAKGCLITRAAICCTLSS